MSDNDLVVELNILRMQLRRIELEVHALGQKVYQPFTVPKTKAEAQEMAAKAEAARKERDEREAKEKETPVNIDARDWEEGWMLQ